MNKKDLRTFSPPPYTFSAGYSGTKTKVRTLDTPLSGLQAEYLYNCLLDLTSGTDTGSGPHEKALQLTCKMPSKHTHLLISHFLLQHSHSRQLDRLVARIGGHVARVLAIFRQANRESVPAYQPTVQLRHLLSSSSSHVGNSSNVGMREGKVRIADSVSGGSETVPGLDSSGGSAGSRDVASRQPEVVVEEETRQNGAEPVAAAQDWLPQNHVMILINHLLDRGNNSAQLAALLHRLAPAEEVRPLRPRFRFVRNPLPSRNPPPLHNRPAPSSVLPRSSSYQDDTLCQICFDSPQAPKQKCCGYRMCRTCYVTFVTTKVSEASVKIGCPNCRAPFDQRDVAAALPTDELRLKFRRFLIDDSKDPLVKTCPSGCGEAVRVKRAALKAATLHRRGLKVSCSCCTLLWCFPCHAPWHEDLSCKEHQMDREFEEWTQRRHTMGDHSQVNARKCPSCGVYIQRSKGCPAINCTRCGITFCYVCGKKKPGCGH